MKKKYTPYVMAVFLVICMFAVFRMDTCASNGWFQEEGVWFYRDSNKMGQNGITSKMDV